MIRKRSGVVVLAAFAVVVGVAGLQARAGGEGEGDAEKGRKIYFETNELEFPSCAHCHATVPVDQELKQTGHIRPAFPVYDSSHRGAWKNQAAGKDPKSAGDAGNICVKAFQKREKLEAAALADLNAFLLTVSPDKDVEPRKIHYAPKIPDKLDGGDAEAGAKKVQIYCATCHGKTDEHLQFELKPGRRDKRKVAMKVRGWVVDKKTGKEKFKPNAGQMSFFAIDRLPDADLLDILAYVGK
jgi:mono/diheme cytochrome c family protein